MKTKNLFHLLILLLLVTACEVKMAPSDNWSTWFRTQSDSNYYRGKAEKLVKQLSRDTFEYEINRVAVCSTRSDTTRYRACDETLSRANYGGQVC